MTQVHAWWGVQGGVKSGGGGWMGGSWRRRRRSIGTTVFYYDGKKSQEGGTWINITTFGNCVCKGYVGGGETKAPEKEEVVERRIL